MTNYTHYIHSENAVSRPALVLIEDQVGGTKSKRRPEGRLPHIPQNPDVFYARLCPRQRAMREVILQDPRGEGRT